MRTVYLPKEQRRITWSHVRRLQDIGRSEGRDFRCECCGKDRELCEAMLVGRVLLETAGRSPVQDGARLVVCLVCYGFAEVARDGLDIEQGPPSEPLPGSDLG